MILASGEQDLFHEVFILLPCSSVIMFLGVPLLYYRFMYEISNVHRGVHMAHMNFISTLVHQT